MKHGKSKVLLTLFSAGLLFFAVLIRSGIIVDRSFLPRYLMLAVFLLVAYVIGLRKRILLKKTFFECSFILFYGWNLLSCLWSVAPSETIVQAQLVFLSLAVFLVISGIYNESRLFENIFIKTHLVVLTLSFGLAFYKMSTLDFFDPYKIISVSANNNLYSGFLLISLPLVLAGYSLNRGFWRYYSLAVAVFCVFFIIITQSRASYIGLTAAVIISFILLVARYKGAFSRMNIISGILASVLLTIGVSIFYTSLDETRRNYFLSKVPVWEYFRSYKPGTEALDIQKKQRQADFTHVAPFDYSEEYYQNANLRIIFWKKSLCLIKSYPVAGVGAGNWKINIASCPDPPNPEHTLKNFTYSQPHNEWIGFLSELGILGFIFVIILFFVPVAFVFYRIWFTIPRPDITAMFYASFIFGFYLFASFDFPFKRVEHNLVFFTIYAFLLNKVTIKQGRFAILGRIPKLKDGLIGKLSHPWRTGSKRISMVSALFILLLLFTIFIGSVRIRSEFFTLKMFINEHKNEDKVIYYAGKAENPLYRITPNTLPVEWFKGVAYYRKGDVAASIPCFQEAIKSTPYEVRALNDYAAALFAMHQPAAAKSVLLKTITIDPWFDDARFNLSAIYYFEGKKDSALFYVKKCRESVRKSGFLEELGK